MKIDLKKNLKELAAKSQKITEFALVRDASGRYVEVEEEDGGMGAGTAIKAGAGAAALGGAGFGAYRADKAIMDKYGKRGLLENMDSRRLPAAYAGTSAAGTAAATRGQAYGAAMKDVGNAVSSRFNQGLAAGKQAYQVAGDRATAAAKYPGFTLGRIGRAIKKGLKIATRM